VALKHNPTLTLSDNIENKNYEVTSSKKIILFIFNLKSVFISTYLTTFPLLITFIGEDWVSKLVPGKP
jgi:hypothetical protein